MMLKVEMSDMAELMKSITDYEYMANTFTQLTSGDEREILQKFWNEKIVKRDVDIWMKPEEYKYWREINFHVIKQTWGNTSGGWQGIGGSAMTNRYTIIIENEWYGFACIYYSGKLAYICEMDDKYKFYAEKGYKGLPGCQSCRKYLTVIYRTK